MTIDLSEFSEKKTPWHVCAVSNAYEKVSSEQSEKLTQAFAVPSISAVNICEVIKKWTGLEVPVATVRRHRRGECSCQI
jgi:hypothetical protein